MLMIGETFQAASVNATQRTVVVPSQQIEGDAPNRDFLVEVRNTGVNPVYVQAYESVNGTVWTRCLNRAGANAGLQGLVGLAQGSFEFRVGGSGSWLRLEAIGITTLALKFKSMARAPLNV